MNKTVCYINYTKLQVEWKILKHKLSSILLWFSISVYFFRESESICLLYAAAFPEIRNEVKLFMWKFMTMIRMKMLLMMLLVGWIMMSQKEREVRKNTK